MFIFIFDFLFRSGIFSKDQSYYVTISNYGLVAMLGVLSVYINRFGFYHFATRYLLPYLVVNFWLIFYTFMQHTDKKIAHYSEDQWNFIRGALATVDRPYHYLDFFHHEIGTSHVLHHFFSRIPHYHAAEATEAIIPILGEHYVYDPRNVFAAFWEEYVDCKFVVGNDGVLWFERSFKKMENASISTKK